MINSITLLGSASGRNAGDAALLSAIMDSCDEACNSRLLYEIPSIRPEFIWQTYTNRVRPISIMPWDLSLKLFGLPTLRSVLRTDLSLVFDATLFDRSLYNPLFNFLSSYAMLLPLARRRGKKMACYTVTVGPVKTPRGKDMLRRVLEIMDFITVRDRDSLEAMREAGVQNPNVLITNDCALNTLSSDSERLDLIWQKLGLEGEKEVLALNINPYFDSWAGLNQKGLTRREFVDIYVQGVAKALRDISAPLLFVSTQHLDESLTKEIMAKLPLPNKKVLFSNKVYSHHDIRGLMERVSLLFAMRLHCLILTSAGHTPIIALSYLPKVDTYMKSLDLSDYCLGFDSFTPESISAHIRKGWEKRGEIRKVLDEKIPGMKTQAQRAALLVAALGRGEDLSPILRGTGS